MKCKHCRGQTQFGQACPSCGAMPSAWSGCQIFAVGCAGLLLLAFGSCLVGVFVPNAGSLGPNLAALEILGVVLALAAVALTVYAIVVQVRVWKLRGKPPKDRESE